MSNIHILQLSKYTTPNIVEDKRKDYVSYGDENNFFNYLIDRYVGSATNNAIIKGVSNQIFGKGLDALDSKRKPNQYAKMKSLLKDEDLYRIIFDRKLLGMAAMQITYDKGQVKSITHFPMETLRASKIADSGKIESWFYHHNWVEKKPNDKLKEIKSFGFGNKKGNEIYVIKPYVSGYYYYTPVDYVGALPYALLEEEISDYLINDTINGFSGTKVINFNNGVPDEEKQKEIKNDVLKKVTGARGEKVIVAFNNDSESKTTVEDLPLNDAPAHYQYLSDECRNKLIVAHGVTSPLLIGVREAGGGLGSNADEIKNSAIFFDNIVIKPYQNEIINALNEIFAINNISLKLYFKTIQPLEFTEIEGMDSETKEQETGVKMSKQCDCVNLSKELSEKIDNVADELIKAADEDFDDWEIVDESDVDYNTEQELDEHIKQLNTKEPNLLSKIWNFATTGTARPNAKSEQDKKIGETYFKVRYRYTGSESPQRVFCKKMMSANKLYRKEDIIRMGEIPVNAGFGIDGADTYSIWKYKGSVNCKHKWMRVTFKSKSKGIDTKSPLAPKISTNKAEQEGYRVRNPKEVSMMPNDMPNGGAYPG